MGYKKNVSCFPFLLSLLSCSHLFCILFSNFIITIIIHLSVVKHVFCKDKGVYRTNNAIPSSDDESDAEPLSNAPNAQYTPSNNAASNQRQISNTQPADRQLAQSIRQKMQAQADEHEKHMEALGLRQQQLDQIRQQQQKNASLQRPPSGQSSIFNKSVPAKSFNFDQTTIQQRPPESFSFGPALPLPPNFSSIFNVPLSSCTYQNATVQRQNRFSFASSRLPSSSSETSTNNFSPQTPNVVKRQPPNANAPIRTTEQSQTPANSLIIYSKIKAAVKAAKVSVVSTEGNDTVCFVQLRQTNVLVKFRSDMRLTMGYNVFSPFLRQQVADYGVEIASVYGIHQPAFFDRDGWTAFLRQTVDVMFSGYYIIFELQIQNVFMTIGFLKPSNDTTMPSSRQQQQSVSTQLSLPSKYFNNLFIMFRQIFSFRLIKFFKTYLV